MEVTLLYFFSTLAQSFAALTAFVYIASQARISWIDNKVTATKKTLLYSMNGASMYSGHSVDFQMNKFSATEVAKQGRKRGALLTEQGNVRGGEDCLSLAEELESHIRKLQELRKNIKYFVFWGLFIMVIGIIGIPVTSFIKDCWAFSNIVMGILSLVSIVVCLFMGNFIYKSLEVSLKNDIN